MQGIKSLLRLFWFEWRLILLATLLSLVTFFSGLALLSLSGWFITASGFAGLAIGTALAFNYILPAAFVRLFSFLRIVGRYAERIIGHDVTLRILKNLRVSLYEAIEPLAPRLEIRYRASDLMGRLLDDVGALDYFYLRTAVPLFLVFVFCLSGFFYLQLFSQSMASIFLVGVVFVSILSFLGSYFLAHESASFLQKQFTVMREELLDVTSEILEILVFDRMSFVVSEWAKKSQEFIFLQVKLFRFRVVLTGLVHAALGVLLFLLLYVGVGLVAAHHLNGAIFSSMIFLVIAGGEVFFALSPAAQFFSKTRVAANRLEEVKTSVPPIFFESQTLEFPSSHEIVFDEVSFAYEAGRNVFNRSSFTIHEGERVGIVGASGIGKTTLFYLLTRAFDPSYGRICVGGADIRFLSESDLRRQFTFVSQKAFVFTETVRANLLLANPLATEDELWGALKVVNLHEVVRALPSGLDTWLGEAGVTLSGGQARRLCLARAVLHNAPIWLLDEPTEGLDQATQAVVMSALNEWLVGKTVLIASHRSQDLMGTDRVIREFCGSDIGRVN